MSEHSEAPLTFAAKCLDHATALLITAGAGMGVDSGLPDFRGPEGFWRAYPAYRSLGLHFEDLANPRWFRSDPPRAWGFYGHRLELYRKTVPHEGFAVLRRWGQALRDGSFVFTSNVDAQFQRAGFAPERVSEVHGSIHHLQCTDGMCDTEISSSEGFSFAIDPETFRAAEPLPKCARCGRLLRPNILMFGDGSWRSERSDEQHARLEAWLEQLAAKKDTRLVIVECGAGLAIPTVRSFSEQIASRFRGVLVRINLRDPDVPPGHVGLALGALAGLRALDEQRARTTP